MISDRVMSFPFFQVVFVGSRWWQLSAAVTSMGIKLSCVADRDWSFVLSIIDLWCKVFDWNMYIYAHILYWKKTWTQVSPIVHHASWLKPPREDSASTLAVQTDTAKYGQVWVQKGREMAKTYCTRLALERPPGLRIDLKWIHTSCEWKFCGSDSSK